MLNLRNPFKGQAVRSVTSWSNNYECYREEVAEKDLDQAHIVTSEVRKHRSDDPDAIAYLQSRKDRFTLGDPSVHAESIEYAEEYLTHAWYPGTHKPVLDIDMDCVLLESSTPGHHHLFIDKEMSWEDYCKLMDVMAEVGILEEGYVRASKHRKYSAARLPWVKKGSTTHPADNPRLGEEVRKEELL